MGCGQSSQTAGNIGLPLGEGEEKAAAVEAFLKTAKGVEVVSVERIENAKLRTAYDAKLEQMMSANGASAEATERKWLFHGTDESTASKIAGNGFDRSYHGKDAVILGKGVYFARDASLSASPMYAKPNSAGIQHIFLVRVAVGEYCVGERDAMEPGARPDGRLYDTTVDKTGEPSLFVTYDNAQQVPEYLIKFTSTQVV